MSQTTPEPPLVLTFHPFNFKVRDVIRKNFHILKNDPETSSIFSNNPLVSFRHSKNIRETLVHSSLPQELSLPCGTFPCGVGQCKTCKFIDSSTTISAPKFVYHIKHHFTCTSHLIYCILCSRCGMLYIGKTGRCLRTRFGHGLGLGLGFTFNAHLSLSDTLAIDGPSFLLFLPHFVLCLIAWYYILQCDLHFFV